MLSSLSTGRGTNFTVLFCYFAMSGTWCLESLQVTMKSEDFQGILERNILTSDPNPNPLIHITSPSKGQYPKPETHLKARRMDRNKMFSSGRNMILRGAVMEI